MQQAIFILLAFIVFVLLFERARLGSVVGLLVAGAVVGPHGIGLVFHAEAIEILAELGVTFLLFNIGLELKFDRLRLYGPRTYALAALQFSLTATLLAIMAKQFGLDGAAALVVGSALALSSTALVLQVLSDLGRTITQLGRLAIAILLIQDVLVGPILVMVDTFGTPVNGGQSMLRFALHTLGGASAILLCGKYVLPKILSYSAQTAREEVFLAVVLVFVVVSAWGMQEAGSSAAIGAFIAGLTVADTEYRHQIAADISPFRGLLLGVFFMAVGMSMDVALIWQNAGIVLLLALGLVSAKFAVLFGLSRLLGHSRRLSVELGALLCQGSEFSFVILSSAVVTGVLASKPVELVTAAVGLSMMFVSIIASAGRSILDRFEGQALASPTRLGEELSTVADHVVIIGFGQIGIAVTRHLMGLKIPTLVIDYDSQRVRSLQSKGLPVYFGNALRSDVLRSCQLDDAKVVVVAVPDADVSRRILDLIHRLYPEVAVLVRAVSEQHAKDLLDAGAAGTVLEGLTTALDFTERVVLLYDPEPRTETVESSALR